MSELKLWDFTLATHYYYFIKILFIYFILINVSIVDINDCMVLLSVFVFPQLLYTASLKANYTAIVSLVNKCEYNWRFSM